MTGPVRVGIVLGSDSDLEVMLEAVKVLDALGVGSEVVVASAHRTPERTHEYASTGHAGRRRIAPTPRGGAAATVRIGKGGAANAGMFAAQILAAGDAALAARLVAYRRKLADEVEERAQRVAAQMKSGGAPKSGT